jgi:hypothetical protein
MKESKGSYSELCLRKIYIIQNAKYNAIRKLSDQKKGARKAPGFPKPKMGSFVDWLHLPFWMG